MNLDWTQTNVMEAGPELDELVAERIMGWALTDKRPPIMSDWVQYPNVWYLDDTNFLRNVTGIPPYSTDMTAAWQVVEYLRTNGCSLELQTPGIMDGEVYSVYLQYKPDKAAWNGVGADTASLAICRAAVGLWLMYTNGYPWQKLPAPVGAQQ